MSFSTDRTLSSADCQHCADSVTAYLNAEQQGFDWIKKVFLYFENTVSVVVQVYHKALKVLFDFCWIL